MRAPGNYSNATFQEEFRRRLLVRLRWLTPTRDLEANSAMRVRAPARCLMQTSF